MTNWVANRQGGDQIPETESAREAQLDSKCFDRSRGRRGSETQCYVGPKKLVRWTGKEVPIRRAPPCPAAE